MPAARAHFKKDILSPFFCCKLARFSNPRTATPENRSIVKIVSARRTHHIYYLLFLIYYLIKRAALPKARHDEKTARHSARFYALRAARCADGSRPIPTNIPETDFFYKPVCPPCGHISKKSYRRRFCRRLARFVNLSTATPENRSIVKIVSARRTHHIYYFLFII